MSIIHTEAFTVGSDTDLPTHDSDWAYTIGSNLNVRASSDDVRVSSIANNPQAARWNGTTVVNQKITAKIVTGANNFSYPGLLVRAQSSNQNGYLAEWSEPDSGLFLYRVTGATPTYTEIDSAGSVAKSTTYNNCYVQATGDGSTVSVEAGDDTNGKGTVSFADTNAARYTSGQPGLSGYEVTTLTFSIDDVVIDDLVGGDRGLERGLLRGLTRGLVT